MDHQKNEQDAHEDEDLKTFDMYHFFSRKDVLAMMVFIVVLLMYLLFKIVYPPAIV